MKCKIILFALFSMALSSCCILGGCDGCTDPTACNYDPDAKDDDGTCNYGCATNNIVDPPPPTPPNECSGNDLLYYDVLAQVSVNVFDYQFGSPYQGQVISLLTIRQDRYESCVNGSWDLAGYTENLIAFKNLTQNTVSFGYQIIQTAPNGQTKEYQNFVAQLLPGQTYQINTGDNTFYNLNSSSLLLNLTGIFYQ